MVREKVAGCLDGAKSLLDDKSAYTGGVDMLVQSDLPQICNVIQSGFSGGATNLPPPTFHSSNLLALPPRVRECGPCDHLHRISHPVCRRLFSHVALCGFYLAVAWASSLGHVLKKRGLCCLTCSSRLHFPRPLPLLDVLRITS